MKEGEIEIISTEGKNPNNSNYICYKTMRNGDVVQIERYEGKAWDDTYFSHITIHGSGRHGQFGGIWSKSLNTYRCTSVEEANRKGNKKLEKFLNTL